MLRFLFTLRIWYSKVKWAIFESDSCELPIEQFIFSHWEEKQSAWQKSSHKCFPARSFSCSFLLKEMTPPDTRPDSMSSASESHHLRFIFTSVLFFICFSNVLVYFNWGNFLSGAPNGKKGKEKGFLSPPRKIWRKIWQGRRMYFFWWQKMLS